MALRATKSSFALAVSPVVSRCSWHGYWVPITTEKMTERARRVVQDIEFAIPVLAGPDLSFGNQSRVLGQVLGFGKSVVLLHSAFQYPFAMKEELQGHIVLGEAESMLVHPVRVGDRHLWIHGWYERDLAQYLEMGRQH